MRRAYGLPHKTLGLPPCLFLLNDEERRSTTIMGSIDVERDAVPLGQLTVCPICKKPVYWLRHAATGNVAAIEARSGAVFSLEGDNVNDVALFLREGKYSVLRAAEKRGFHAAWPDRTLYALHTRNCLMPSRLARWVSIHHFTLG